MEGNEQAFMAGLLAIERASDDRPEAAMDAPGVASSRTQLEVRSRLPPGTSGERAGCARATGSRPLLECARELSRRAAKALEPELARPGR